MDLEKSKDCNFSVASASVNVKQPNKEGISSIKAPAVFQSKELSGSKDWKIGGAKESRKPRIKKLLKHPPTAEMALDAIKTLKVRKGVPLRTISKFIDEKYDVDIKIIRPHLNKFLKNAVDKGDLERVSGVGAAGRFKIKKKETSKRKR